MKKNYFLTLLVTVFLSSFSFGQTLINENFDYGATAGDLTAVSGGVWKAHSASGKKPVSYANTSLTMTNYPSSGVGGSVTVNASSSSAEDVNRTFAQVTSGSVYAGALINLTAVKSGDYFMHFRHSGGSFYSRVYVKDNGSGKALFGIREGGGTIVYGSTAYDLNKTYLVVFKYDLGAGSSSVYVLSSVTNTEPGTPEATVSDGSNASNIAAIAFRQGSNIPNATIDGVRVATTWSDIMTQSTTPSLSISAPGDGTQYSPETTSVKVKLTVQNFNVANGGTGDGYIKYKVNAGTATDKFDTNDISLTSLSPGDYAVEVELVDNSGNSLSTPIKKTVNFKILAYTDVANLAALRAGTQGKYYRVTGEVNLTYNVGNSRNQRYLQDASAGILIDDNGGIITTSYNVGDGITNLKGKLSSYGGVLQLVPTVDPGAASSNGNTVTPKTVTLADLKANINDYESEWVKISSASFDDADGTARFAAAKNYNITEGGETIVFRTQFSGADFIGNVIPSGSHNITGIAARFNSTVQIFATQASGIALGVNRNEIPGLGVYPNPVSGNTFVLQTASSEEKTISLFSVLGKQVLTQKVRGARQQIDISGINTGVYILKVIEGERTATKKLVIR